MNAGPMLLTKMVAGNHLDEEFTNYESKLINESWVTFVILIQHLKKMKMMEG
jgi:hypothetical protein